MKRGFGRERVLSTGRSMHKASGRARLGEPPRQRGWSPGNKGLAWGEVRAPLHRMWEGVSEL